MRIFPSRPAFAVLLLSSLALLDFAVPDAFAKPKKETLFDFGYVGVGPGETLRVTLVPPPLPPGTPPPLPGALPGGPSSLSGAETTAKDAAKDEKTPPERPTARIQIFDLSGAIVVEELFFLDNGTAPSLVFEPTTLDQYRAEVTAAGLKEKDARRLSPTLEVLDTATGHTLLLNANPTVTTS